MKNYFIMVVLYIVLFIRFLLTVLRPLTSLLFDYIGRFICGEREMLPPITNILLLMPATELAAFIRKRMVTASEVMDAYIRRAKAVNPMINAYVDQRFKEAMKEAESVDSMLESTKMTGEELAIELPLLGVPFSCKEVIGVKGMRQTDGLLCFKDRRSPEDAEVVVRYRKAGAIPYIVTNVPTMSMGWETSNLIFGRTLNPYNKLRTVGGSSGGEAAIIAAAGAVIGIGTDIGGSIRIPSAFCGIYGHKPSRGLISNQKPWPNINPKYEPFRSTGPMCRYVNDLRTLVRISIGGDVSNLKLDEQVDFRKVKLYYMEELPGFLLSATSDVKEAVRKAVEYFDIMFDNPPTKVNLKEMAYAFDMWQYKFLEADGPPIKGMMMDKTINWYWELLKWIFHEAEFDLTVILYAIAEKENKDEEYHKCLKMYEDLKRQLEEILDGDAVLLLPTHPEPAPHCMTTIPKTENIGYTNIFNTLGYPVTNIPAGMSCGVPIGLQAVATQYKDRLTLAVAEELNKVFGGWESPCEIRA